eukprot:9114428-Karenia_brevis.AAC.1
MVLCAALRQIRRSSGLQSFGREYKQINYVRGQRGNYQDNSVGHAGTCSKGWGGQFCVLCSATPLEGIDTCRWN